MTVDRLAILSQFALFSDLQRPLLKNLAMLSGLQRFGKGSILFNEGERPQFLHALVEGRLSLITGPKREQTIADFMDAGDVVLIPPCLLDLSYMVTAKAITDLQVMMIPADKFRHLCTTELPLAIAVSKMMAKHWRLLLHQLTRAKSYDAESRLVQYLLDGVLTRTGRACFTLQGAKQDLAAHLGMTPATLSRSFKRLRRLGIETTRSEVKIENVARLRKFIPQSNKAA